MPSYSAALDHLSHVHEAIDGAIIGVIVKINLCLFIVTLKAW